MAFYILRHGALETANHDLHFSTDLNHHSNRITDATLVESNSPALTTLYEIVLDTFYQSGRLFAKRTDGLTQRLAPLMTQHGIEDVQTRTHTLLFTAGTPEGQLFSEDMRHFFRLLLPFFQKWTRVPSDYQEISQQAFREMQEPGFVATWQLLTAWGVRQRNVGSLLLRGLK